MAASADLHRKATEASEAEDQAAVAVAAMRVGAEAPIYGKALVEAAFKEIFPNSFQTALPVRNVKVRFLTCANCKQSILYVWYRLFAHLLTTRGFVQRRRKHQPHPVVKLQYRTVGKFCT